MQIKKKKPSIATTVDQEANPVASAKSGATPMSVSAALGSLKVKQPSATTGMNGMGELAKTKPMDIKAITAKTDEPEAVDSRSEEYKERIKKRAK